MKTPDDGWDPEEQETLRDLQDPLEAVRDRHRADPPIELLRAARAGVIPEDLQNRVARYLEEDAWGRALIDGVSDESASLDRNDETRLLARIQAAAGEPARRPPFWRWFPALAAAAACLILLAGVLVWRSRSLPTEETRSAAPAVAATPAPPAPALHLALEAPPVKLSVAVLTWRGADEKNHLLADLKPGLDAFRKGDYVTANVELSKIAATYPDSFDVRFYQGVSQLLTSDATGAIESLTAAKRTADSTLAPAVSWYLAVAHERAGNKPEARQELTFVCKNGAAYAAEACAALQQIQ